MSTNPFTLAHEAIWTCLEASPSFTDLVASTNRIKFTGTVRDPWERLANCQSFPSVAVIPAGGVSKLCADSDTTDVEKQFTIYAGGGGQRVGALFDVEFAVLRAMADWRGSIGAVTWSGKSCVLACGVFDHPEQMETPLMERGIRGWNAVWSGRLLFSFETADLNESTTSSGET